MKKNAMGGCLVLALTGWAPLAVAQAAVGRVQATSEQAPLLVLPISVQDEEHRSAARLRDLLRQPYEDSPTPDSRPYRLSPEERLRLREQLRSPPDGAVMKGRS